MPQVGGGAWNPPFSGAPPVMPMQVARGPYFEKYSYWETFPVIRFLSFFSQHLCTFYKPYQIKPKGQNTHFNRNGVGTSLVVQWLRICLAMQRIWVWSLVGELGSHMPQSATQPMCHNYGAYELQSPCTTARDSAGQWKILPDTMKILHAPTKPWCSQINK